MMGAATNDLLHSLLMVLNTLPGKQALLLVPIALGYSKLNPEFCSSKADAHARTGSLPTTAMEGSGSNTPAATIDAAVPGLLGALTTQLMGQNQFASVSVRSHGDLASA
jgi:hypothetical protein